MRIMDTLYLQPNAGIDHVPDQILVKVRQGQIQQFFNRVSIIGLHIIKRMNLLAGYFVILKTSPKPIQCVLDLLGDLPEVEYAEPNFTAKSSPLRGHFESDVTNPLEPWQKFSAKQAAIDVIDAKIDLELPRIESEIKVNSKKIGPSLKNTFVDVSIKDLLFLSDAVPVNLAEAVEVIDYATKMDVDIVSNTWVKDGFSKALDDAINIAEKKGISFVASARVAASLSSGTGAQTDCNMPEYSHLESRPSSNVCAGVLSLYIAQEAKEGRSGRGRLIVKSVPSKEQIKNEWLSGSLEENARRPHSQNDIKVSQNYSFPGAKFIKFEIVKFNEDTNLELIKVRNSAGMVIHNISAERDHYETDYIETNLITVEFHSNEESTSIGSMIRNVRVIY